MAEPESVVMKNREVYVIWNDGIFAIEFDLLNAFKHEQALEQSTDIFIYISL